MGENSEVLIDGLAGESTRVVALEGSLARDGDPAVTAQQIRTGILGDERFEPPVVQADVTPATAPSMAAAGTSATEVVGPPSLPAGNYAYKFVWSTRL